MVANWGVNAIFGLTAFLLTYFFSFANNTWQTSSLRGGIGFLLFFILGYMLRFLLYQIGLMTHLNLNHEQNSGEKSTPEAEQKNDLEEMQRGGPSFQPIPLHSLHNEKDPKNPEKIVDTFHT
jgi:hypothetical protein